MGFLKLSCLLVCPFGFAIHSIESVTPIVPFKRMVNYRSDVVCHFLRIDFDGGRSNGEFFFSGL